MGMVFVRKMKKSLTKAQVKTKQFKKKMNRKKRQKNVTGVYKHSDIRKAAFWKLDNDIYEMSKKLAKNKYRHTCSIYSAIQGRYRETCSEFSSVQVEDRKKETIEPLNIKHSRNNKEPDLIEESEANNVVIVRNVVAAGTELPVMTELPADIVQTALGDKQVAKPDIASNKSDLNGSEIGNEGTPNQEIPNYDIVVQFRGDEEVLEIDEADESLSIELQKERSSDIETPPESVDDELPVEESTLSLRHDTKDVTEMEDQSVIQLKVLESELDDPEQNVLFEVGSLGSCVETNEKKYEENKQSAENNLNELKNLVKNSPGLRMITPDWKNVLKKLIKQFFKKKYCLQTYQKTIFNNVNFRQGNLCLNCYAVRYDGLSVMPCWVWNEIRRFLSFTSAEVDPRHPVILRLARDGFFSDNGGLVYCCFCGTIIQNYLLLPSHHDHLVTFLDQHCNRCVRTGNIPADEYGSSFNLADVIADYGATQFVVVPSGTGIQEQGGGNRCLLARWIHNIGAQNIVPSGCMGMRPSLVPSGRLPLPNDLFQTIASPPLSIPARLSSMQDIGTPSQPFRSQVNEETQQEIAESHAQQNPQEAANGVSAVAPQPVNTGMDCEQEDTQQNMLEVVVRAEMSDESAGRVSPEVGIGERLIDNTQADIERELPEIHSSSIGISAVVEEKRAGLTGCNLTSAGAVNQDCPTDAAAAAGVRILEMADFDPRIESFNGCLCQFSQTPQAMALAGLFYIGPGDVVRCYMCGGCLQQWQQSDDPLIEHIRNYPTCEFIWHTVIDMQMCDDTRMPEVLAAFADSREGVAAQNDGYTRAQVCEAVERLIFNREKVTRMSLLQILQEM